MFAGMILHFLFSSSSEFTVGRNLSQFTFYFLVLRLICQIILFQWIVLVVAQLLRSILISFITSLLISYCVPLKTRYCSIRNIIFCIDIVQQKNNIISFHLSVFELITLINLVINKCGKFLMPKAFQLYF